MRGELADMLGHEPAPSLAGLAAYLEVDAAQTGDALLVTIGLASRGGREVALLNPFVLLQLELRDGAGYPLALPAPPSPLLINAFAAEDWTFAGGPAVVAATRNGDPVTPNVVEGRVLRIDPDDELAATFALDRLLRATPAAGASDDLTMPIAAGDYAVGCILTLIDAGDPGASRILSVKPVPVRLNRTGAASRIA